MIVYLIPLELIDVLLIVLNYESGTFRIKIGEMVSMPKSETDQSQDNQCSRGLHVANSTWLSRSS